VKELTAGRNITIVSGRIGLGDERMGQRLVEGEEQDKILR
jgi:hypothetical protein